jgi:hypothetical protein
VVAEGMGYQNLASGGAVTVCPFELKDGSLFYYLDMVFADAGGAQIRCNEYQFYAIPDGRTGCVGEWYNFCVRGVCSGKLTQDQFMDFCSSH